MAFEVFAPRLVDLTAKSDAVQNHAQTLLGSQLAQQFHEAAVRKIARVQEIGSPEMGTVEHG